MSEHHARLAWGAAGALVATVACVVIVFPWGLWVGARDVRLLQAADRADAFARCAEIDAVAIRWAPDRDRPERDVWRCYAGSRRAVRDPAGTLHHPLQAPTPAVTPIRRSTP
jgi:hypothetical protein